MIGGLLAFVLILFACACNGKINNDGTVNFVLLAEEKSQKPDWWQTGSFYQIYPRSFKDTNNDGVGDLNGKLTTVSTNTKPYFISFLVIKA